MTIREEIKNEIQSFASVWDARECTEVILKLFEKLIDGKIAKYENFIETKKIKFTESWTVSIRALKELKEELNKK